MPSVSPSADPRLPVVVGVDWDPSSAAAVDWAADYAGSTSRPLLLLHATLWPTMNAPYGLAPPAQDFEEPQGSGTDLLDRTLEHVRAAHPGLDVQILARAVSPMAALLTASAGAHLVVVGRRGTGRMLRLLAGEVGTHVATHAACAVAVVRAQPPGSDAGRLILVGHDGSPTSAAALDFGFSRAAAYSVDGWPEGRRAVDATPSLLAVHVVRSGDPDVVTRAEQWLLEEVQAHGVDFPEVMVQTRIVSGHPMDALVEASATAGLVVVGDRGRGGFTGLRLGSVAQGLLHHTDRSVVIVRSPES